MTLVFIDRDLVCSVQIFRFQFPGAGAAGHDDHMRIRADLCLQDLTQIPGKESTLFILQIRSAPIEQDRPRSFVLRFGVDRE